MRLTTVRQKLDLPFHENIRDTDLQLRQFHVSLTTPLMHLISIELSRLQIVKIKPQWRYLSDLACVVKDILSRTSGLKASGEMSIYTLFSKRNGYSTVITVTFKKRE